MRIKALIAGLVLSSVGLGSGVSHAAVTQISLRQTGTACNPVDNSSNEAYDPTWIRNEWGFQNGSTAAKLVVCPVVAQTGANSLLSIIRVNVWDRSAAAVSCDLWRIDSAARTLISSGSSLLNQTAQQQVSLSVTSSSGQSANGATLSIICSVPGTTAQGGSGIVSIETVYQSQ